MSGQIHFFSEIEGLLLSSSEAWTFRDKTQNPEQYDPEAFMLVDTLFDPSPEYKHWKRVPYKILAEHVRQMVKEGLLDALVKTDENGVEYIHLGDITLKGVIHLQNLCRTDLLFDKMDEVLDSVSQLCNWINGLSPDGKSDSDNILYNLEKSVDKIRDILEQLNS